MSRWISTKERLPENSGRYLAFAGANYMTVLDYSAKNMLWNAYDDDDEESAKSGAIEVKYWRILPEPPDGEILVL